MTQSQVLHRVRAMATVRTAKRRLSTQEDSPLKDKNKRKALHARRLTFCQAEFPLLLVSHSEEQVGTSGMQWHIEIHHCHFGSHVPSIFQYEGFSSDVCFSHRGKKMMSTNICGTFKTSLHHNWKALCLPFLSSTRNFHGIQEF